MQHLTVLPSKFNCLITLIKDIFEILFILYSININIFMFHIFFPKIDMLFIEQRNQINYQQMFVYMLLLM